MIWTQDPKTPRCEATVDLLSRVFRPFNFLVTVRGLPPHEFVRRYRVAAPTDDDAACVGMQEFAKEFMPREVREQVAPAAPGKMI